ncbi:hypothetical protein CLOM_g20550 [Closterium sp. NIES-68]|nr:hypothetical protein CLOM_g20550 [Closterium sp. NIES-68]GJP83560.1 hypothetical protein CLOP_g13694 [Closterium sp. NIES-67]
MALRQILRSSPLPSPSTFSTPLRLLSTAHSLLASTPLAPGSVVVQSNADSPTGQALIQEAKQRGLKTINIIPDQAGSGETIERLKRLGGDVVVTESYCKTWFLPRVVSDLPKPALGVTATEGAAATAVAKLVAPGGTLVAYGGVKLSGKVVYGGAERRPVAWGDYLKGRKLALKSV